jgi:thioredoxin reductase (NADPH)
MLTKTADERAFPTLTDEELEQLKPIAIAREFEDGDIVFKAGDQDADLYVIESGALDIINPANDNRLVVSHGPGQFSGDIDLIIRRQVVVTGVARGHTRLLCIPPEKLQEVLIKISHLSDKLVNAFQLRRELLSKCGKIGMALIGYAHCRDTTMLREFLHKNFLPFTWYDSESESGIEELKALGNPSEQPVIRFPNGNVLKRPTIDELAEAAGLWHHCPNQTVDLVIIGAGPAGITTAVYAASEGINTLVLEKLGPGGQAGGSSKIENFIGFPAGLTGMDLALRGVLQMHKFGARLISPATVVSLEMSPTAGGEHTVNLDCGGAVKAKAVLLAGGVNWRKLDAKNADRYERAGVYYACTSVEAMLHDKEDVAVVGAGNSAGQAAVYLSECCKSRTVHVIARGKCGPNMSDYLYERIRTIPNIVIHEDTGIDAIAGGARIQSILTTDKNGKQTSLALGAVFVFIGADPGCEFLPKEVKRDDKGYVLTGAEMLAAGHWPLTKREPCSLETSVPGLLAAGDIRSGSTKRVGFAVGDGSQAVSCVHRLLSQI